jgi:MFS family permease
MVANRSALSSCFALAVSSGDFQLSEVHGKKCEVHPWPSPARAWYALIVLTVALMFATIDRSILSLLVEPIKADLGISDTGMSLLIGFAFVFFYAFLGLPIARLADVYSRRLIIGFGIAFWSVATALCGLAQNFWQLFWARVGVGAGESSFAPATYSILTDSFRPEELPKALAVNSVGFVYGHALALIVGGAVIQSISGMSDVTVAGLGVIKPWQLVFFAVGLPGLIVAAVMATVKEPVRRGLMGRTSSPARPAAMPLREIYEFLRDEHRTYGPIFGAMGIKVLLSFGMSLWLPTFFIRTYDWTASQIGYAQGLVMLIVAPFGLALGGWLAGWYARRGYDDANIRVVLFATIGVMPLSIVFPLMPDPMLALALYGLNYFVAMIGVGPGNAALQIITPNEMRSQVRAMFQFVFNIVGYAIGPLFVALFTDYVFGAEASLRYSMSAAAVIVGPLAVLITWYGLKPYGRSVARARQWA